MLITTCCLDAFELLNQPLSRTKLKILSPFDNLLIQRKRMQSLFNFDYLLECYVPEAKRQFGYFQFADSMARRAGGANGLQGRQKESFTQYS